MKSAANPSFDPRMDSACSSPMIVALVFALAIVLVGRIIETVGEWCLTWIHLKVNRTLIPRGDGGGG